MKLKSFPSRDFESQIDQKTFLLARQIGQAIKFDETFDIRSLLGKQRTIKLKEIRTKYYKPEDK